LGVTIRESSYSSYEKIRRTHTRCFFGTTLKDRGKELDLRRGRRKAWEVRKRGDTAIGPDEEETRIPRRELPEYAKSLELYPAVNQELRRSRGAG